jgi:hypothetical protein
LLTILQIIATIFSAYLLTKTISLFRKKKLNLIGLIFWSSVWTGIIMMAYVPGLIGLITRTNPADLVVRVSIIAALYMIFNIETQIGTIKEEIKKLGEKI